MSIFITRLKVLDQITLENKFCFYRVSPKKLNTYIALNFRALLNMYANLKNIYEKSDSIAF